MRRHKRGCCGCKSSKKFTIAGTARTQGQEVATLTGVADLDPCSGGTVNGTFRIGNGPPIDFSATADRS